MTSPACVEIAVAWLPSAFGSEQEWIVGMSQTVDQVTVLSLKKLVGALRMVVGGGM